MPASIQASFQGTAQAFQASLANEPLLILAALITVYIVLGVLYESYIHPITILSTLPSAGVGAILALLLCRQRPERDRADRHHPADRHREEERDHDDRLRAGGRARARASRRDEAIYQACLLRFRPIMMTTMAALLGGVPLAFGTARARSCASPLGITIVGGLICQPGAHALHDAGHLPASSTGSARRGAAAAGARRRDVGAASRRRSDAMSISDAVHPPAGRHSLLTRGARCWPALLAYRLLPVAPLPQVEFPTIQVSAGLPGASPETMASAVATPLERQFGRIAGVTEMTSTSSLGLDARSRCSSISNRDIDAAARDVQAAINAARGQLPAEPAEQSRPTARSTRPTRRS